MRLTNVKQCVCIAEISNVIEQREIWHIEHSDTALAFGHSGMQIACIWFVAVPVIQIPDESVIVIS
jgi:hypothetical protein